MDNYDQIEIEGIIYAIPKKDFRKNIKDKRYAYQLLKSNIPKFYHNIEWDDYKGSLSKDSVNELQKIAKNINHPLVKDLNLYLWGSQNSTQKTAIACNFAKECIKQGLKVKFMNFGMLVNFLMKNQGFSKDEESYTELYKLKNSDIIILDDCFDPNKSLYWKTSENNSLITSEIDVFFRTTIYNEKRLVLTSNYPVDVVRTKYSNSLYELVSRNFKQYEFLDSIKNIRQERFEFNIEDLEGK